MKTGACGRTSSSSSHLCKPVLNGLSDLLRLPQYPVLGVRAAASTGVRREGELYTRLQVEGKGGSMSPRDAHKSGDNRSLGAFLCLPGHQGRPPRSGKPAPAPRRPAHSVSDPHIYVVLEAGNRNAGYADRPSPLPAKRRPERPGLPAFGPDTGPPAKDESGPPPIARKRAALDA